MAVTPRAARRLAGGALLFMAAYYAVFGGEYSAWDLRQLRRRNEVRLTELRATKMRVDSLRARVRVLERDDSAVERIARERFGMVRPGETLYRFVRPDSARGAALQDAARP